MAKITAMPATAIISGFKGVLDYYVNYQACDRSVSGPGIPCVRRWPRSPGKKRSAAVEAQWPAFTIAARLWNELSPEVQAAYNSMAMHGGLNGRDLASRAYLSGLFAYPTGGEETMDISCRVTNSAVQAIPHGIETDLIWNTERWDTDEIHDNVANNPRLTAKTAGKYLINCCFAYAAHAAGLRCLYIVLNGVTRIADTRGKPIADNTSWLVLPTIYQLEVGDYVTARAWQNSGGALNSAKEANSIPEFMMTKIA